MDRPKSKYVLEYYDDLIREQIALQQDLKDTATPDP